MKRAFRTALFAVTLLFVTGCASWPRSWGSRPCCVSTKPVIRRQPIGWHLFDVTVLSPFEQSFHLVRVSRKLFGVPVRSLNLRDGVVADTAFFTNRDPASLTPETVRWGPTHPDDVSRPPFVITKAKHEGKTPGFFVTDAKGDRYLLKLDPVGAPGLLSGAEVVTSKLLYALGYHVPSYEIASVRSEDLRVDPAVTIQSGHRLAHPFTEEILHDLLGARLSNGTVRVSASKILDGDILGPAHFKQFRDCADIRALKVVYAWVNNIDAKDHNSLLVWDGTHTVGYLIDFGTSLGADAGRAGAKSPCAGWTYLVDLKEASLEVVTLGLHRPVCDADSRAVSRSAGLFSPHLDPDHWKPYAPNLAFGEMNAKDARWMARRMARLSRQQIEAAVSAGQYSNPEDAAYLVDVLEQRRMAIVRHYLEEDEER